MQYSELAEIAARVSGDILLSNLGKVKNIEYKSKHNLVTEIDKLSEKSIIDIIKRYYPKHSIFAEESGKDENESDFQWIIDPLDGTTNYAHSYPFFCISIALRIKSELVVGVVYDPVKDEMFKAERGRGAFLNDNEISVSKARSLSESNVSTGFLHDEEWMIDENLIHFSNFIKRTRAVRRDGSAALDLCYVACGRFDGFWEIGLNPWDTSAGYLIVVEAGGKVTNFNGDLFDINEKEILASNSILHSQMVDTLSLSKNSTN